MKLILLYLFMRWTSIVQDLMGVSNWFLVFRLLGSREKEYDLWNNTTETETSRKHWRDCVKNMNQTADVCRVLFSTIPQYLAFLPLCVHIASTNSSYGQVSTTKRWRSKTTRMSIRNTARVSIATNCRITWHGSDLRVSVKIKTTQQILYMQW